jgi:hypothetical protein
MSRPAPVRRNGVDLIQSNQKGVLCPLGSHALSRPVNTGRRPSPDLSLLCRRSAPYPGLGPPRPSGGHRRTTTCRPAARRRGLNAQPPSFSGSELPLPPRHPFSSHRRPTHGGAAFFVFSLDVGGPPAGGEASSYMHRAGPRPRGSRSRAGGSRGLLLAGPARCAIHSSSVNEWRVRSSQGPRQALAGSSHTVPSRHGPVPSPTTAAPQAVPLLFGFSLESALDVEPAGGFPDMHCAGSSPHAVLHHSPRGRLQALPARCVLREALDRAVGASFSPPWLGTVHTGGGGAALFGISLEAELDVEPAEASQICTAPGAPSGSQAALDPRARPRHPLPARCVLREAINGLDSPGASIRVGSSCLGWIPDRIGDSRSHRGGPSGHGAFFSTPAAQAIGIGTARRLLLRPVGRPRWRPLFPHMPPASHLGRGEAFDRYQKAPRRATRSNAIPPSLSHSGKALPFRHAWRGAPFRLCLPPAYRRWRGVRQLPDTRMAPRQAPAYSTGHDPTSITQPGAAPFLLVSAPAAKVRRGTSR